MRTDVELPITRELLSEWFSIERTVSDGYHHLLLKQTASEKWIEALDELVTYFEKAHLDARTHFHYAAGINLHPVYNETDLIQYPNSLPPVTQRGLFGEVLCGLITECFNFVGDHKWNVPVFLFRYHQDVEHYFNRLVRGGAEREVLGRLGDDFLGLAINEDGTVAAILVGEAKFRTYLSPSDGNELINEVHKKASQDADVPVNIHRLCELLKMKDDEAYLATRTHLERVNLIGSDEKIPRCDLICLVVQKTKREYPPTYIPQKTKHEEYTCDRELQAVEVIIDDACELVEKLYKRLYNGGGES